MWFLDKRLRRIEDKEDTIIRRLDLILSLLIYARSLNIISTGGSMSTVAGSTSNFQEVPTPAGSQFPSGTTFSWTVDDTADITLAPSTDGTECQATCVATPAGTSYNLTCTSSYTPPGATTPISATVNVPITAAPPVTPTGMTINQVS